MRKQGFTMIELMIVLAIVSILAGLGISFIQQGRARGSALSASNDLMSSLSAARARAIERGSQVWFILYPNIDTAGAAGGHGAYFVYEDIGLTFGSGTGARNWGNFVPPADVNPEPGDQATLIASGYLDDYPGNNAAFGAATIAAYTAPFAGLTRSACSFCTGSPLRGAIVFMPEGSARFVDHDGAAMFLGGTTAVERAAAFGVVGQLTRQEYLYGVSGPTGFIGMFQ